MSSSGDELSSSSPLPQWSPSLGLQQRQNWAVRAEVRALEKGARFDAHLASQQRGLRHLTVGLMHVSSSENKLTSLAEAPSGSSSLRQTAFLFPPVPADSDATGPSAGFHSPKGMGSRAPLRPSAALRSMLRTVASLAEVVPDQSLEHTLAAARFHRFVPQ